MWARQILSATSGAYPQFIKSRIITFVIASPSICKKAYNKKDTSEMNQTCLFRAFGEYTCLGEGFIYEKIVFLLIYTLSFLFAGRTNQTLPPTAHNRFHQSICVSKSLCHAHYESNHQSMLPTRYLINLPGSFFNSHSFSCRRSTCFTWVSVRHRSFLYCNFRHLLYLHRCQYNSQHHLYHLR